MIRKVLFLFVIAALFISCNNTQNNSAEAENMDEETNAEVATLAIVDFDNVAGNYVGKEVQISGLVSHACKHGGKRMFIIDEETEQTVKIEASETVSSFDAELEGSVVSVTGIINELIIDEAYLIEWEAEIEEEMSRAAEEEEGEHVEGEEHAHAEGEEHEHADGEEHEHAGGGLGEKADMGEHISGFEKIENFRKEIKESGKDHLAFYSIECISFEVIPEEQAQ